MGIFICLDNCAESLVVEGAENSVRNGVYRQTTNVNGKPAYFQTNGEYGLWFDGDVDDPDWNVGRILEFDEGKFSYGYIVSNDDTNCPNLSTEWQEGLVGGGWKDNPNFSIRPR